MERQTPNIAVYIDDGIDGFTTMALMKELLRFFRPRGVLIRLINAKEIVASDFWRQNTTVIVIPGGEDLPYCTKLNGRGNESIHRFVNNGGGYLGVCAGAYFACKRISFDIDSSRPIQGPRELGFFPGVAVGSLRELAPIYDPTLRTARVAQIHDSINGNIIRAYYHGWPKFLLNNAARESLDASVLATFADLPDRPAAIVKRKVWRGVVILTGVHLEVDSSNFGIRLQESVEGKQYESLVSELIDTDISRRNLIDKIFGEFNSNLIL